MTPEKINMMNSPAIFMYLDFLGGLVAPSHKGRFFPSFFRSDRMVGMHAGQWDLEAHGVRI